jgi:hypothetical protein
MQDDSSSRRSAAGSVPPPRLTIRARRKLEALEPAIGYHVILRLKDERVIAATQADRRAAACIMIRQGRERGLLACAVVDAQAHAIVLCSRAEAGAYAGRTATSLSAALRLDVAFDAARIAPIRDQRQLANTFDCVLLQQDEHGSLSNSDFHDGTNLPDLIGMRVNGAYSRALLRDYLPRVSERALLERFRVDWSREVDFDPALLIEATLAATGGRSLKGRKKETLVARRAAAGVARLRMEAPELAQLFGIDVRTAFRLRSAKYDHELARAIELQLRFRWLRSRGG